MVSFSGLLAISLVLLTYTGWKFLQYSDYCYLAAYFISIFAFFYIRPHRYIELQIAQCILTTSKYLKLRGDLWELNSIEKITKKTIGFSSRIKQHTRKH
jgi:hypothetical protein